MNRTRRERLVGVRYQVSELIWAEVRRACRDEFRLVYEGDFNLTRWQSLAHLGDLNILEASKINPAMKDIYRLSAPGFRIEGALGGDRMHAFLQLPKPNATRHRLEEVLRAFQK